MNEPDRRVIVAGKETVVRRPGASWSFHLPKRHAIEVDREANVVHLDMPLQGSMFELAGIEETGEEVIVKLGPLLGSHGPPSVGDSIPEPLGYPLPQVPEELERIKGRWLAAGLPEQEANAWAQGASHEDQLARLRRRLREVGG